MGGHKIFLKGNKQKKDNYNRVDKCTVWDPEAHPLYQSKEETAGIGNK